MHEPREQETIFQSLRSSLTDKIADLTNFTEGSFNYVWTQAFSAEIRELELDATAAYLEGFIDYSGGPIEEDDLRRLNLDDVTTVEEINDRLNEANLDELVRIVGIERDDGSMATGEVTFTTDSTQTDIPEGTSVSTQPDSTGDIIEFVTTEAVSTASGDTEATASIEAVEVGESFNVGAGTLTHLPDPPPGVQSSTNDNPTSGGVDRETNDELRQRAKQAIFRTSGGGTAEGVVGFIETNVEGVSDVRVEELFQGDSWHGSYPHAHVVVDGGDENSVLDAIDEARPVAVEHILVRPDIFNIHTDIFLSGEDIDTTEVADRVATYFDDLEAGDDIVFNRIIQTILNADENIVDVDSIDLDVENELLPLNEETIDDFEDGNITIENRHWSDWSGDTGSFSAQSGTVIEGSNSGELSSANANVSVNTSRSGSTTKSFEVLTQIDSQTGNASDVVSYTFEDSGSDLGSIEFRGDGNIVWSSSSDTTIDTWSAGSTATATLQFDFDNDTVDVTAGGSTSTGLALTNSVSGWDTLRFGNDTTASGSTVNAYTDDIHDLDDVYPLGLGRAMETDGIMEVDATVGGNSAVLTEDTDYREFDSSGDGDDDALQWILSGDRPDLVETSETREFRSNRDTYPIDDAMVDEGVLTVEDSAGTTYDEGTDWEETDTTNNGRDNGIEWLGASEPDDGTNFTVTYTAGTATLVDYDIVDDDITINDDEKANNSSVNVTVL